MVDNETKDIALKIFYFRIEKKIFSNPKMTEKTRRKEKAPGLEIKIL